MREDGEVGWRRVRRAWEGIYVEVIVKDGR